MTLTAVETLPIRSDQDVVVIRQRVRARTVELGFSLVDQTKMVTAASELARNTLQYGKGGDLHIEVVTEGIRRGLRLSFVDQGPGIVDIDLALTDGYTTGGGLGLGLSGSRRLVNQFELESKPGEGTRVTVTRWK
jgi:serine/threonine-protein kinase RsbT